MHRDHLLLSIAALAIIVAPAHSEEYLSGIEWTEPPIIEPGDANAPPSDAVVLFDGKDLSKWNGGESWPVKEGVAFSGKGMITSKDEFGDCQVHLEWSSPTPPSGESQGRGNSGVFLMGRYELQILDSYENETYFDGQASAIYKQTPPMVNAMRPPGQWNTYDILWTAPRFNDNGSLKSPAVITVLHNGVATLNNFELLGDTPFHRPPHYEAHGETGPISLQDHGNPVRFRNIWVRELKPPQGKQVREPFIRDGEKETPIEEQAAGKINVRVMVNGKPLAHGQLVLTSQGTGDGGKADVKDGDAQFERVAPGQYRVSVQSKDDKLAKKYGSAETSLLTIEVRAGQNDFQFELRSP